MWSKERVVALNKLICEAMGKPHAIRSYSPLEAIDSIIKNMTMPEFSQVEFSKIVAEQHPFVDGNKSTACCIAICETLKNI